MITPPLFRQFPDAITLAKAEQQEVFELIKSCSYPNNKAKNLIGMAKALLSEFGGILPDDVDELQKLPGVGRKTANVIASVVFNKPAMAVDTHVFRVSERIGLTTNSKNPLETERQLVKYIPDEKIPIAHHWLILHGRYVCIARKPKCGECGLTSFCRYFMQQK
jgi:endonuclease-3